ncbi:MAG: DUF3575 domain-containing protein [Prevotellaceae bacterium]|nr:DUF3575 domain-containing protein [Prevotellaceae bacterium]
MGKNIKLGICLAAVALFSAVTTAHAQKFALKTNALYWATSTPNLGAEISAGRKNSVQVFYGLNPWKSSSGKSIRHWSLQPEYRHWFCGAYDGWFIGVHAMGGQFNMGNIKLPFGILSTLETHRYEGWYVGGGISAGYQWALSVHWNIEASIGVGYDYIKYDKFECGQCGVKEKSSHTNYVGPTKAAVNLIYIF